MFIFIGTFAESADTGMNSQKWLKCNPIVQHLLLQPKTELGKYARFGVHSVGKNEPKIAVFVRTTATKEELVKFGYPVNSWIGGIATMDVSREQLLTLVKSSEVLSVEGAVKCPPVLDVSTDSTVITTTSNIIYVGVNAKSVHNQGIAGQGVVVGDVDTGIDIYHGDFQFSGVSSRIVYIWDQTDNTTGSNPVGFNYGTEYTQAQINMQLSLSTTTAVVNETDSDGHGSHVMGIIAENGQGTGNGVPAGTYTGLAPQADIIMVKTDFYDTHIVDGIQYIFSKASSLHEPAVVNLSIGDEYGPHDGTDALEESIDSTIGPGNMVVIAAGNDGGRFIHAENNTSVNVADTTLFGVYSSATETDIDLWYKGGDIYTCTVMAPDGTSLTALTLSNSSGTIGGGTGFIYNNTGAIPAANSDGEIFMTFSGYTVYGSWIIILTRLPLSSGNGHFDAWYATSSNELTNDIFQNHTTQRVLVTEPGNVKKALTVGAYCTKTSWVAIDSTTTVISYSILGDIAGFSGIGPSRDSTFKPEITAPGQQIAACLSGQAYAPTSIIMPDGKHDIGQGTSYSAPHVTGAVALILEEHPTFSYATIKSLLYNQGTRADFYTGTVPDMTYRWGYGKLNVGGLFPSWIEDWQKYHWENLLMSTGSPN